MKSIWTLLLLIGIFPKLFGQDIENLEDKLTRNELTVHEKIETLNLLSRGLTFINPIKAVTYANEALRLSTETDNQVGIAYAYRNLSNSYSYNESYFISMEYLQRAMDIFSNIRDSVGIANCYISLGHTYRGLQNRGEEIKYNKMSFDLFTRLKIIERIGVTSHNLGESYLNNGDIEKS